MNTEKPAHNPVITKAMMDNTVNYEGVVLTSIDVVASPTDENPKRVTFSDSTGAALDDKDSVFLCNIKEISRGKGKGWDVSVDFEATVLTPLEAHAMLSSKIEANEEKEKVLFVIHGFNTNASFHLADCSLAKPKFVKTHIIPIIWPSEGKGSYFKYREDRSFSKVAGNALKSMKGPLQKFRDMGLRSSIVAHSMGNRVLRNFSDPEIKFDNIFMVAADVEVDIFYQKYIESNEDGLNIKKMLTDETTGKIHVLYNSKDGRMFQSMIMNLGKRLGGAPLYFGEKKFMQDTIHDDLKNNIVDIDVASSENRMLYDGNSEHNYHFFDKVVQYYDEHA